ncbi:MAG: hypothetical protein JXA23_11325, partial [Bacteroidales bacterium]|nr:hypothetical protein [Bacteroidales bacterium]
MRAFFLGCCLLGLQITTFGQWIPTNGPYGGGVMLLSAYGNDLYTATNDKMYLSTDTGSNWSCISSGLPDVLNRIMTMVRLDTFLFIGTQDMDGLVFRAGTGTYQWTIMQNGLHIHDFPTSMEIFGGDIYLATIYGVYRSENAGELWNSMNTGLAGITCLVLQAHDDRLYAGTDQGSIFYLDDPVVGWLPFNTAPLPSNCDIFCLCFRDSLLFAGTSKGVFRTADGGCSWDTCNTGLTYTYVVNMAWDSMYLYATGGWDGVFRSADNGNNWEPVNTGLPYRPVNTIDREYN